MDKDNNYDEFEELHEKDYLLAMAETIDLTSLSYFLASLYSCKKDIDFYMSKKQELEKLKRSPYTSQDPMIIRLEKEISNSPFNNMENFTRKSKAIYERSDLLENDADIISAFQDKILELKYDKDNAENRALCVQTVINLLSVNFMLNSKLDNPWQESQDHIACLLQEMSTDDAIMVYHNIANPDIHYVEAFYEAFSSKLEEMSTAQFLLYIDLVPEEIISSNSEIFRRAIQIPQIYTSKLIEVFHNDDNIVSYFLKRIKREDRVNAITTYDVFNTGMSKTSTEILKIVNDFSNEELVRYLFFIESGEFPELKKLIQQKNNDISDDDLKFLLYDYSRRKSCDRCTHIIEVLLDRKLFTTSDEHQTQLALTESEIAKYEARATQYYNITDLFTVQLPWPRMLGILPNIEDSEGIYNDSLAVYEANSSILNKYSKVIDYTTKLSNASDKIISKIALRNSTSSLEANLDEQSYEYLQFINNYLSTRIITLTNDKDAKKLALLYPIDGPLCNAIYVRMSTNKSRYEGPTKLDSLNIQYTKSDEPPNENEL